MFWSFKELPIFRAWAASPRRSASARAVSIAGVTVRPGDLVVADEVGVCFVPFERAAEVLAVAQHLARREEDRLAKLASGLALKDWIKL